MLSCLLAESKDHQREAQCTAELDQNSNQHRNRSANSIFVNSGQPLQRSRLRIRHRNGVGHFREGLAIRYQIGFEPRGLFRCC